MLNEDVVVIEDTAPEALSTLEALDDIAGTIEAIVVGMGGDEERDAYLALADEYESLADNLMGEAEQAEPEEIARLSDLETRMAEAFQTLLQACPAHIRNLHEAARAAIDAEEALEAA